MEPEPDKPYAELWIGTHGKATSEIEINNNRISLREFITDYPNEILGKKVAQKFNNKLPFLFKVLSIDRALSIQAHPDKNLAMELHKIDPVNYPDENHKPEIAIAINKLTAIIGLKSFDEICEIIKKYNEFSILLDQKLLTKFLNSRYNDKKELIKTLYSQIMHAHQDKLEQCVKAFVSRFKSQTVLLEEEKEFLIQYKNFNIDVGLISILLFNFVHLKKDEALFTKAGIPHAYLRGNIIECMANSDNVVRAGLTQKYKDVATLVKMLEVDSLEPDVKKVTRGNVISYKTNADEFEVASITLDNKFSSVSFNYREVMIFLILEGTVKIIWGNKNEDKFVKGESFLIPASLNEFLIKKINNSKLFYVKVP